MRYGYGNTFDRILPKLGDSFKTFEEIFPTKVYEDWDYNDLSSQVITTGFIDSITSSGSNAGVLQATGTERPMSVFNATTNKYESDFDGVNDTMSVLSSTSMYNFLHNTEGGMVVVIARVNTYGYQIFIDNANGTTSVGLLVLYVDTNSIGAYVGGGGPRVSYNNSPNNNFLTNQYNSIVNIFDNANTSAAERNRVIINGGVEIKNNIELGAPNAANSAFNLTVGSRSGSSTFYLKGQIQRILIIRENNPTPTQLSDLQNTLTNEYGNFPIL